MAAAFCNRLNNIMKANGNKGSNMEMAIIKSNPTTTHMQENSLKESKQVKAIQSMEMALYIQESFITNSHMESVIFNMLIKTNTSDNLLKVKSKEKEPIILAKLPYLQEFGKMIKKFKDN